MRASFRKQNGLTMVELLVAMAISLIIAIAAIASLIVSRKGFNAIDASSQLRDNGRFAMDLIQRIAVQAGYKDVLYIASPRQTNVKGISTNPDPDVFGIDNKRPSSSDPFDTAPTTAGINGSDILMVRFQTAALFTGATASDKSMIDCQGSGLATAPIDQDDRITSAFYVGLSTVTNEPALMCATGPNNGQPIIDGVEDFQVLYGVDAVTPNTAPTGTADSITDRYLRADQMTVSGNAVATNANWRRVRSLRIGLVLRGPVGSAQDQTAQTFYPLGLGKNSGSNSSTPGSAMASSGDVGSIFSPAADGRLRQVVTFTVHLRNDQSLKLQSP
ncbi:MAG: PilW family protein [Burkholderiales bacterium]|nr:PilW family protein [Burkholderiales bacterium]